MRIRNFFLLSFILPVMFGCGSADNKQVANTPADSPLLKDNTVVKDSAVNNHSDSTAIPVKDISTDVPAIEQKIFDTVIALPEVKERSVYIEKQTGGKRHLQLIIAGRPEEMHEPYYWVQAVEDNGDVFVPHFNFYVYPSTFEIKYYDTVDDSAISLDEWRASLKKDQ